MRKVADLHTHTAHSREADNFLEMRLESFVEAKRRMPHLVMVGVLDHDTLNYLEPMYRVRKSFSPELLPQLLPGIEISCAFQHPTQDKQVQTHVIGYFPQLMEENETVIRQVNTVLEPEMTRALEGKIRKNVDIRLGYFFSNGIIPEHFDFDELKVKVLEKLEEDKKYMESNEPKKGDIINWPLNSSEKMVVDVLVDEGVLYNFKEGKHYADRRNEKGIADLTQILVKKYKVSGKEARQTAEKLHGSCHGDYNDDFYKLTTQDAITLIIEAGGIPILAHPMISVKKFGGDVDAFFEYMKSEFLDLGLKGMEAFYPKQEKLTPQIINFCEREGLYITGGSDDHQNGLKEIGDPNSQCPIKYVERMLGM
jgi:predicted metal-dependent phosphoesterase TrpH